MIVKKIRNQKTGSTKAARVAGVANYIVGPQHDHSVEKCIHHEVANFLTDTHEGHVSEMIALAQDAVRSKDPIDHWVLSWAPNERPSVDQVREAVNIFLGHCGLTGHQVIWGLHDDTEHLHVHIAINRVHPETLKVIEINKGFQLNAAHQAIALIEKKQGWQSVENARYQTNEQGELVTDRTTQLPKVNKDKSKPLEPTGFARDREIQTGQKSAQRIGIEQAAPIIANATSWKQLHEALATVGIEYRRDGSGAKLFIGETAVKASDVVDRKNNFGALQKRLGLYQPAHQPELKHDPHGRQTLIDNPIINPYEQNAEPTGFDTFDTLRILSRRDLDVTNPYKKGKTKVENFLQFDESTDHGRAIRMRRGSDRHRTEGSTGSPITGGLFVQPLTPQQPGWIEYQAIRTERREAKESELLAQRKQRETDKDNLHAKHVAERADVFKGNWQGKGDLKNALSSVMATQQAAEKLALQERHKDERDALHARYVPLPQYKAWQAEPRLLAPVTAMADSSKQPERLSTVVLALTHTKHKRGIAYQDKGQELFIDQGRTLAIVQHEQQTLTQIAAALSVAQQKYGVLLTVTGPDEFKRRAVQAAVKNNLIVKFADPAMENLRLALIEANRQAAQEVIKAAQDAAKAATAQAALIFDRERDAAEAKNAAQTAPIQEKPVLTPAPVNEDVKSNQPDDVTHVAVADAAPALLEVEREAAPRKGNMTGTVKAVDVEGRQFAFAKNREGDLIWHDMENLPGSVLPQVGEIVDVDYADGVGKVAVKGQGKGVGR